MKALKLLVNLQVGVNVINAEIITVNLEEGLLVL